MCIRDSPIAFEETEVPAACPGCGAPRSQFLEEPWCGSIEKRRIHVDPPEVDPNRDPFDISFHPVSYTHLDVYKRQAPPPDSGPPC